MNIITISKKLGRHIWIAAMAILILAGGQALTCHAQENSSSQVIDSNDPLAPRANGYIDDGFYEETTENDAAVLTNEKKSRGGVYQTRLGMDVSYYQGDINWTQARNAGIEFAIIRVGYRGSENGVLNEDSKYQENIQGALNAGMKVGVYIFSQAVNEAEAIEEANYLISRVYKYNITLPLVIDYEYRDGPSGRLYNAHLSREAATSAVNAFCQTVSNKGYTAMVYANKNMLTNHLNANNIEDKYRIWLAHYTSATNYTGIYDFWQYTSKESGARYGCSSTYLDMDYWYDDGTINGMDYGSVFDALYYGLNNPDVVNAVGWDSAALLTHFVDSGMAEGRQGCDRFNVFSYYKQYPDLRQAFGGNLKAYYLHYMKSGRLENRQGTGCTQMVGASTVYNGVDYSPVYDFNYYVGHYSDLYNRYSLDPDGALAHFVNSGMNEARQARDSFNPQSYRNCYLDLRRAFGGNWSQYYLHYINSGRWEGRTATGYENQVIGIDGIAMYRMYNPNSGEHFYTANGTERDQLARVGWNYEGVGWYAPESGNLVYRVYNPNAGDHHYTMSADEKNHLVRLGWRDEGVACYSDVNQAVPLYRAYNPNARAGSHNYTMSGGENASLCSVGWKNEGIAWYGIN